MEDLVTQIPVGWRDIVLLAVGIALGALAGRLVAYLVVQWVHRFGLRKGSVAATSAHRNLRQPTTVFITLVGILIAIGFVGAGREAMMFVYAARVVEILLYGVGAWFVVEAVEVFGDVLLARYSYDTAADNFRQRKAYTQVLYIKRVVTFLAVIIAFAFVLFQFERVRELGTGLLASAGVAGIIIGVAAQKSLSNLLAGFQIAFTQPLRIDDQVVISGEFGRVEEITLTYVVIKIWDERRLIVPLNKVIDDTFQNWSRHSTQLIGAVMLYLDYGVDLEALRAEAKRLTEGHELWDKRVSNLQVTDTSETCMTVRVLASASTPGDTFTLRCALREGLLRYLREHEPEAFPLRRSGVTLDANGSVREMMFSGEGASDGDRN